MNSVYKSCKDFLKKYPGTVAWRVKKHSNVVEEHINDDEVVLFSFVGQKNSNWTYPLSTVVVTFTNKRMLVGRSLFLGRSFYTSITPDMLNDFEIRKGIIFGVVEIDTVKEHFTVECLSKKSLSKIEDALSKYLVDEKIKMLKKDSNK